MHDGETRQPRPAFGRPGIPPRWTSSAKEGVGTAYSTASTVWFTLSHGILNEIYYPTIDHPQTRDFQFLVTDGATFLHEEKRDLATTVEYVDRDALAYRIVNADPGGRYRIVKEIICDPHQPCVLVHARLEAEEEWRGRLRVYALLSPHLEVGGWGNSARRIRAAGRAVLAAWKGRAYLAMGADTGFTRASCGYVGASDGWQDLRENFRMDWEFDEALDGNVAVMGEIDVPASGTFTVGLGFGDGLHAAVATLTQSLSILFGLHRERYVAQWHRVTGDLPDLDRFSGDGGRLYRVSRSLLLAHEDKRFAGAIIASASIPWGDAKGDEDLGGYHLVWTRDLVNSATALLACGDKMTPFRALVYLACSQREDGGFAQNFWIDGTPYWNAIQMDEVAFPIILAWRLRQADALSQFDPYPMVRAAAAFLIREGPATRQERWEENGGYSPSTLAATIAGLVCAADFASLRGDEGTAAFIADYADFLASHLESWTVTTRGTLLPGVPRHFIRILPADPDDPSPPGDPDAGEIVLHNRPPGTPYRFPAREIVDPGFLELVRYGIRRAGDPLVEDSLRVVDAVLKVETPYGPCWHRYNHDGYGERPDGGPYEGWGKGRAWPILTGERAHYELAAGRDVRPLVRAMEQFAAAGGMLPEQVWDEPERPGARQALGRPTGAAMPLMWAHAEYIKLLRSLSEGQAFDFIAGVAERYIGGRGRRDLEVWKPNRHVERVGRGQVLRVVARDPFRLHWTVDEWRTPRDTDARDSGLGLYFADVAVDRAQSAPVRFTFLWTERGAWEGRDYAVEVG